MSGRHHKTSLVSLAAALFAIASAAPAHAEWLKGESEHFVVYGDVGEGAMRNYVRKVERFDAILRLYYPISQERESAKLEIFLADGHADMARISPRIGRSIAGFYLPSTEHVFAVVDLNSSSADATLFHEYSHHFMLANLPGAYPAWFVEGFAEFYSTADLTPGRIKIGQASPGRYNSLNSPINTWVPMEVVLGSSTSELRGRQGYGYYAQSWLLMNYLMSTPERQQMLKRYLQATLNGVDSVQAMTEATGRSTGQLQSDIYTYSTLIRYSTLQLTVPEAEVAVTRLPASAEDLLWLNLRLDRALASAEFLRGDAASDDDEEEEPAEADPDRARAVAEARADFQQAIALSRTMAARHSGDRLAAVVLAKAEMAAGDWTAAEAALAPSTTAEPADAEALRLTAVSLLERAGAEGASDEDQMALKREARSLLSRSLQADPQDFRTYLALDESRWGQPGYPNDNDLNTLLAAEEYAPQVRATRYRAAQALIQAEVNMQAIEILTPIANDPHGGSANTRVRALLNRARVNAGLTADTSAPPPQTEVETPEGETAPSVPD